MATPATKSLSTAQVLANRIREAIYEGELAPGDHLVEEALAERYTVSRGPIREAIRLLSAEGTVVLRKNRGAVVNTPSLDDVLEVYALRLALGSLALNYGIRSGALGEREVAGLRERLREVGDFAARGHQLRMVDADLGFQAELMSALGLPRVARSFRTSATDIRLFVQALKIPYSPSNHSQIVQRHGMLLDALAAGDARVSTRLWREHIQRNVDEFTPYFAAPAQLLRDHPMMAHLIDPLIVDAT